MADATDSFGRANETPLAGNWTTAYNMARCNLSASAVYAATNSVDSIVLWNANAFTDNQYSQITLTDIQPNAGPAVRLSSNSTGGYVASLSAANQFTLYRLDSWTNLGVVTLSSNLTTADVVRLEASGANPSINLKMWLNGVVDGTVVSVTGVNSGYPGFAVYYTAAGADNWLGGPIAETSALQQEGFRFINDDGNEATATFMAAQDVSTNMVLDTNTRIRFIINSSGDMSGKQFLLEYKRSTESTSQWCKVNT